MPSKDDLTCMEIAYVWAKRSHAERLQVGCVIARNGRIVGTGYNGTPSGVDTTCEETKECPDCGGMGEINDIKLDDVRIESPCGTCQGDLYISQTKPEVLHAEQNALMHMARNGISTDGTVLYVTHSPCEMCAKLITQAGVIEVVYDKVYRDVGGIKLLQKLGIVVRKI